MSPVDEFQHAFLLGQHTSGANNISPEKVFFEKCFNIFIDQPESPVLRKKSGNGKQTQGGSRISGANNVTNILVIPETKGGKFSLHKQTLGGLSKQITHSNPFSVRTIHSGMILK
jgi:hypothetical protein